LGGTHKRKSGGESRKAPQKRLKKANPKKRRSGPQSRKRLPRGAFKGRFTAPYGIRPARGKEGRWWRKESTRARRSRKATENCTPNPGHLKKIQLQSIRMVLLYRKKIAQTDNYLNHIRLRWGGSSRKPQLNTQELLKGMRKSKEKIIREPRKFLTTP